MQRATLIGGAALLLALSVAFFVMMGGDSSREGSPEEPATRAGAAASVPNAPLAPKRIAESLDREDANPSSATDPLSTEVDPEPLTLAAAEAAWERAHAEHLAAIAAREEAERVLDDLGRDLDGVEGFVEDLEERGEDPARHAFEAMEKLDPIIEQYEERLEAIDRADELEEKAAARADAARIALERFHQP